MSPERHELLFNLMVSRLNEISAKPEHPPNEHHNKILAGFALSHVQFLKGESILIIRQNRNELNFIPKTEKVKDILMQP